MSRNRYSSSPLYGNKAMKNIEQRSAYGKSPVEPLPFQDVQPEPVQYTDAQAADPSQNAYAEPAAGYAGANAPVYQQAYPPQGTDPAAYPPVKRPPRSQRFLWLRSLLCFALPVIFIVCFIVLISKDLWYFGAFFIACVLILIPLMWILKAFTSNARTTLTALYGACAAVTLFAMMMVLISPKDSVTPVPAASSPFPFEQTDDRSVSSSSGTVPADTPSPQVSLATTATEQLKLFISYWQNTQYDSCIQLCRPDWVIRQENPKKTLSHKIGDCTPISHTIEKTDGTEADSSRTVTLLMKVKNLLGEETYRRYEVLMLKINNTWYVDPDSLSGMAVSMDELVASNIVRLTDTPVPVTPKPTVNPQLTLYYNPQGGKFYHVDKNCSSLDSKNRKYLQPFYYYELNTDSYKELKNCTKCGAPGRNK